MYPTLIRLSIHPSFFQIRLMILPNCTFCSHPFTRGFVCCATEISLIFTSSLEIVPVFVAFHVTHRCAICCVGTYLNLTRTSHKRKRCLVIPYASWRLRHQYATLPPYFYAAVCAAPVCAPRWVLFNDELAVDLGLDPTSFREEALPLFAGNACLVGSRPLAQAYAGHQFGHFAILGDGRALLLGEYTLPSGVLVDVHLKGSGRTPYSRGGDGRAVIGPMVREYVISEAMHALGIPTTRSLAVVATGELVYREAPLPGAILTRIASSHMRVGTFQFARHHGDADAVRRLADFAIARHDPHLSEEPDRYALFLRAVIQRQAALIAQWQALGFVHGVMNTDNMTISGQTIDYGPCAFLDRYDPDTVFSSIDAYGRYAFCNQRDIGRWNVARFAECLLPLLHDHPQTARTYAQDAVDAYSSSFQAHWLRLMRHKLGLFDEADPADALLIDRLLEWMHTHRADYTNTFVALTTGHHDALRTSEHYVAWHADWQHRVHRQARPMQWIQARMQEINPCIIPRNHFVQEAIDAAESGDMDKTHRLLALLTNPYAYTKEQEAYADVPDRPYRTFCGT